MLFFHVESFPGADMPSLNFERENVLRNTDNPEVARGRALGKPNYRKKHSPQEMYASVEDFVLPCD